MPEEHASRTLSRWSGPLAFAYLLGGQIGYVVSRMNLANRRRVTWPIQFANKKARNAKLDTIKTI